ncbi:hypothetical protein KXD96_28320 (plasmid) [Mycobacterium sp. SMC-2]|uniref:hypothetical protein n=1 Tax=Mycobacterium sp. SMC-2 TaxID=2857058 RepID=UPI0021B3EFF4|nr:hypothetical protein [Mycobacterium sp. SMC-2]UXA06572.1 hypothetical protein KXD96_27795 [Mycobacterium sp. SMC-2]UXA09664.1 hypothetical protein KXD96_28320 [Mycobacterium sp. SMC-2]
MAIQVDVEARLDTETAQQVAQHIRALAKQAVLDGINDAVNQFAASGLLAGNVGDDDGQ